MSYTQHTWVDGETITKEKLNNIEEGINEAVEGGGGSGGGGEGGSLYFCTPTETGIAESYNDLLSAINSGKIPVYVDSSPNDTIIDYLAGMQLFTTGEDVGAYAYFIYGNSESISSVTLAAPDDTTPLSFGG